jgi:hypothetical protein
LLNFITSFPRPAYSVRHTLSGKSGPACSADKSGSAYSACMLSPKTPALHILPAAFAPARRKPRCIAVGFSFLTFAMQRYYFFRDFFHFRPDCP